MRMLPYQHLFISVLCLLFNHSINTLAQHQVTLKDLPRCAIPCAEEAALAAGCQTTDILCLCVHKISTAIIQCSSMRSPSECHPASLVLVNEVLSEMCTADSTTTTSSISSSTIQSGQISITTNSVTPESTSTSQTSSTSAVSSTTPDVVSSLSQTTTQPSSSTLVVVTTVVIPPTSTPTSGAGRLDVSISTRALFFGLPSLISLIAAI